MFNRYPKIDCGLVRKYRTIMSHRHERDSQSLAGSSSQTYPVKNQGPDDGSVKASLMVQVEEGNSNYC